MASSVGTFFTSFSLWTELTVRLQTFSSDVVRLALGHRETELPLDLILKSSPLTDIIDILSEGLRDPDISFTTLCTAFSWNSAWDKRIDKETGSRIANLELPQRWINQLIFYCIFLSSTLGIFWIDELEIQCCTNAVQSRPSPLHLQLDHLVEDGLRCTLDAYRWFPSIQVESVSMEKTIIFIWSGSTYPFLKYFEKKVKTSFNTISRWRQHRELCKTFFMRNMFYALNETDFLELSLPMAQKWAQSV